MLLKKAPQSVKIAGIDYKIRSDFRTAIKFELLMLSSDLTDDDDRLLLKALRLFYPTLPPMEHFEEAVNSVLWFYQCGKQQDNADCSGGSHKQIYSFDFDDDYIYAAFLQQYGIDLQDVKYLHWWKFKAMFKSLKDDTEFVRIMGYRSVVIDKNMSAEQKRFYQKMKKLHKIPMAKSEQEKINSIEEALMCGESIENLL